MEAAKLAVAEFTSKRGHTTEVEEFVRPAITLETIKPSRHEITTTAINKEVHQHHYHTTVQPISHTETLPTKHTHQILPVDKRDFTHKTHELNLKTKGLHEKELALFTNHSITHPVTHTKSSKAAVVGEHVHHHVHETVQPIIFKETHVPEIVHTTVPIREVHHLEAVHHQISEIPMVSWKDFMSHAKQRESIGRESYNGAPRPYNSKFSIKSDKYRTRPAPVDITAARHSTNTPPLSPNSAVSSPSMPSTPKSNTAADPNFRKSEDSMHDLNLTPSRSSKTFARSNQPQMPQPVRI